MKKVVVLGAGLVGAHIAKDLASVLQVTAVDRDEVALARAFDGTAVRTAAADLAAPGAVAAAVADADVVVGAVPGHLGRAVLGAVLEAGRDVVDIAFFPEDALALGDLARERGVTAIVDCGVAPGMSHALLGREAAGLTQVDSYECLVGGLPVVREWPFEYKAPFSPADVIEEYTRPARYREAGRLVAREALTDPVLHDFPGIGTLESLNTDGLRTLLDSFPDVPDMKEKTLRYPGHARLMRAFRDAGFFDEEPVDVGGVAIRPRDLTSRILFPRWRLAEGEREFTVMRVTITGDGRRIVWDLVDRTDPETGATSMARTTGYPAAAAVHLVAEGRFRRPGIVPPEALGADPAAFAFLIDYQRDRGVVYHREESPCAP